jgi:hypothetical protein
MPGEDLPPEIRQFIYEHLRSVEQLEILILLSGKPDSTWSVQTVYEVIVSSKTSVERWLVDFVRIGFFERNMESPPLFRFIAGGETAATVEALARLYKMKPVRIIEAIFRKGQDPAQGFADAFKIKKLP